MRDTAYWIDWGDRAFEVLQELAHRKGELFVDGGYGQGNCPFCVEYEAYGHAPDCVATLAQKLIEERSDDTN